MGTGKRDGEKHDRYVPGPGQYNATVTNLESAPRYTFRLKTNNINDPMKYVVSPGPGNYNPKCGYKTASYSMRIRPKTASENLKTPGPGQYSLRREVDLRVPSYKYFINQIIE